MLHHRLTTPAVHRCRVAAALAAILVAGTVVVDNSGARPTRRSGPTKVVRQATNAARQRLTRLGYRHVQTACARRGSRFVCRWRGERNRFRCTGVATALRRGRTLTTIAIHRRACTRLSGGSSSPKGTKRVIAPSAITQPARKPPAIVQPARASHPAAAVPEARLRGAIPNSASTRTRRPAPSPNSASSAPRSAGCSSTGRWSSRRPVSGTGSRPTTRIRRWWQPDCSPRGRLHGAVLGATEYRLQQSRALPGRRIQRMTTSGRRSSATSRPSATPARRDRGLERAQPRPVVPPPRESDAIHGRARRCLPCGEVGKRRDAGDQRRAAPLALDPRQRPGTGRVRCGAVSRGDVRRGREQHDGRPRRPHLSVRLRGRGAAHVGSRGDAGVAQAARSGALGRRCMGQPMWITEMGVSTSTQAGWPAASTPSEQASDLGRCSQSPGRHRTSRT